MGTENRALEQARAHLATIMALARRSQHARERDGTECTLPDTDSLAGLCEVGDTATAEQREQYHDETSAFDSIAEYPLETRVLTDNDGVPAGEYEILLATGGPAVRIVGRLNELGEPVTADLQCRDWFAPWDSVEVSGEEAAALLAFAGQFWFEEAGE